MPTRAFFEAVPKIELHVHLEGSIRPETVLELARRNQVELPAQDLAGLRAWYQFRDFRHFVEVYVAVTRCIRSAADIEWVAREFARGQAEQNIVHTELTYTASTVASHCGVSWPDQREALRTARDYARDELGISVSFIIDIVRGQSAEDGLETAKWAVEGKEVGVCALGLAGEEYRVPAQTYREAYQWAQSNGLPVVPHAGETMGPDSIRDVLTHCNPPRIGHGVRCVEDGRLVAELRDRGTILEVCPSSNMSLGIYPSLEAHPLPTLMDEGVIVTINSDDPPMFNTTLTDEWQRVTETYDLDEDILYSLNMNALRGALVSPQEREKLRDRLREGFNQALESEVISDSTA